MKSKTCAKLPKISEHTDWHENNLHAIQFMQPTIKTPFTVKSKKELTVSPRYPKEIKLPPILYPTPRDKTYHKIQDHLLESKIYEINLPESKSFDKASFMYKSYLSSSSISFGQESEMVKSVKNQEEPSKFIVFPFKTSSNIEKWKGTSQNMAKHQRLKYKETSNNCISARELYINESNSSLQDLINFNTSKSPISIQDMYKNNDDGESIQTSFNNKNHQISKQFIDIGKDNINDSEKYDKKTYKEDYFYNIKDNILEDSRESGTKYAESGRQYSSKIQSKLDDYKILDDFKSEKKEEGKRNNEEMGNCKEILNYDRDGQSVVERERKDDNKGRENLTKVERERKDDKERENLTKVIGEKNDDKGRESLCKIDGEIYVNNKNDKDKGLEIDKQMQGEEEKNRGAKVKRNFEANPIEKNKNNLSKAKEIDKKDVKAKGGNKELNKNEIKKKQEDRINKKKIEEIKDNSKSKSKNKATEKKTEANPIYVADKKMLQSDKKSLANDPGPINMKLKQKTEKPTIKENSEKSDNETLETQDTPQKKILNKPIKSNQIAQKPKASKENIIKPTKNIIKNPSNTSESVKTKKNTQKTLNQEIKNPTPHPSNTKNKEVSQSPPQEEISISISFESSHQATENESIDEIIEEISDNESFEEFSDNNSQSSDKNSISSDKNQSQKITLSTRKPKSKENPKTSIKASSKLSQLQNSEEFTPSSKDKSSPKQKEIKNNKLLIEKSPGKKSSKKSSKKNLKKEQVYNIDGEDLVIRVNDDTKFEQSYQKEIENKGHTGYETIRNTQESNNSSSKAEYLYKPTLLNSQDSLIQSLTIPQNTPGRKNSFKNILTFPSSTLKIKDPIQSFISNFSIALLETINDIANYKTKKRNSSIESLDPQSISTHKSKLLEKALTSLNKQKDYQDEFQDHVNDLPQNLNQKLHSSISLIPPELESKSLTNQNPTLESFPTTLSEKYKNISKFYSKKTEYEKIPSLLSKYSMIEKISQKSTLKNDSDSSDSDDFSDSLESETELEEFKNNDFLKNSALYEVENFELIKNLAKSIYGDKPMEQSENESKEMDDIVEVIGENKNQSDKAGGKLGSKGFREINGIDLNELNIAFEQNGQRFLFFKQNSIKFETPKLDLNIEKLTVESEFDLENKRRIELKKLFLKSRPRNQSLDACEDLTSLKILRIEENIADQLNLDIKTIQKALKHKKSFSQYRISPSKIYKFSHKHN
ncbi:hypothetical protein SteCoe_32415 [Stentor coeruleus]|uniref:Uncharacterized protein n=1 Tax=Stentor coeruleus TaxID=5963 RepID=A0A1R2AZ38_9CILI|nr:hypothetical protein SteCoe_32415 [Stentor coeruleus]